MVLYIQAMFFLYRKKTRKDQQAMKKKDKKDPYKEIDERYGTQCRDFRLNVPSNLRMLCALLEVKPETLLRDFMWTVSYSYGKATNEQRTSAVDYFLKCGYGENLYKKKDIQIMFQELKAKKLLMINDENAKRDHRERHFRWSHMYAQYWFRKWFYKVRRKAKLSVLKDY